MAGYLPLGAQLVESGNGHTGLQSETEQAGAFPIYNFEVEEWHTYFVGASHLWVHNQSIKASTIRARLREAGINELNGLPGGKNNSGPFRYRPPEGYDPANPLPKGLTCDIAPEK